MTEGSTDTPIGLPAWLVRLCKWCWRGRGFLFGTLIGGTLLNAVYTLPFFDPAMLSLPILAWLFAHWYVLPGIVLLLALLTTLCGLVARLSVPLSSRKLHRLYLERITRDTELATLKGIPAGLISESVRLAEIYIPPRFYANRSRVDFPVSDQELERYRETLKRGIFPQDLERVVLEAEKNWQHVLKAGDRVGLDVVWEQLSKHSAVVIQGFPGMGKSTLMERLTLHMAARGLHRADPDMPAREKLMPTLLPVLLRLGSYARAIAENADLSLPEYLIRVLDKMNLPGLTACVQRNLSEGSCLVMLDGLDEVSDPVRRERVQTEIRALIGGNYGHCRFIITSRVAGYDLAAFPAYPHFTLAELTDEEIDYFLPRWSRANLERERVLRTAATASETSMAKDVEQRVRTLKAAIEGNQGVRELAKNPLLLTLLLVMQQNSIVLPRQRVELYDTVTKTLLENRQIAKDLEPIPEFQAIERLGPLAFQMQETDSDFVRQRDVEEALAAVIRLEGGTEEQIRAEAARFLSRVRERGGLFVSRVGDYFGFMHRTFQEYFAARYILNNMKTDQDHWIDELIRRARNQGALWREPFLLAVAYQSNEDEHVAGKMLRALLVNEGGNSVEQERSVVMFAADAIVEARPLTIGSVLQTKVATRLLACYEQAQHQRDFADCDKIEGCLLRWLLSLPREAYRLPLLGVISEALKDTQHVARQRSVLTLLAMVARSLEPCSPVVFSMLIPPLLALTGLPAIGVYSPSADLRASTDFDVADLALSTLSFLGRRGPSGLYVETMRQYFEEHPEQLRLLARYSVECGTLILPVMIPIGEGNYRQYETAVGQWIRLRDGMKGHIAESIDACLVIQQSLLKCAEEVSYPAVIHLLEMLERTRRQAGQQWSKIWQAYLLEQLDAGSYINYQELALLWNDLFLEGQLQPLVDKIIKHYTISGNAAIEDAQRFIAYFTNYLRDWRDLRYWRDLRDWRYLRDLRYWRDLRDWRDWRDLRYWRDLRDWRDWRNWGNWGNLGNLRYLRNWGNWRYLRDWRYLRYLEDSFFKEDIMRVTWTRLPTSEQADKIDLLTILQGRVLQFQVDDKPDEKTEEEVRLLAHAALRELDTASNSEGVYGAALDVLRELPARTVAEIAFIWEIIDETQGKQIRKPWDEQIRHACAEALRYAHPVDEKAWRELEKGVSSPVGVVREAVGVAMARKK